jgi:hypothetical protein
MLIVDAEIVLGVLVVLGVPALAFLVLLAAASWWRARRAGRSVTWRFLRSVAAAVLLFVVAVSLFETVAAYFRHEPPGPGHQYRQGDAYRVFIDAARFGFFLLYGVVAALGGGMGYLANRRAGGRGVMITVAMVVLFMLLTMPLAEFMNACAVGESFVLRGSC